jgi:G3E family GTPase
MEVADQMCTVVGACLVDATGVSTTDIASVVTRHGAGSSQSVSAADRRTVVVLDADTDVTRVAERLLGDAGFASSLTLDGVVMVVDARTAATRLACGKEVVDDGVALCSAVMADVIIIRHLRDLTERASDLVSWTVWGLNPSARLAIDCDPADEGRILAELAGFDLDELDDWLLRRNPQTSWASTDPDSDSSVCSVRVRFDGCIDPAGFHCWLEERRHSGCVDLYRWHAVVGVAGEDGRWLAQGVRSFVEARPGARWDDATPRCDLHMVGNRQVLRRVGSAFASLAVG